MVKRVFGKIDGIETVFEFSHGNTFKAAVPFDLDGEYVVEIIAEDEAGNRSFVTKMLFCFHPGGITAKVLTDAFFAKVIPPAYSCILFGEKPFHIDEHLIPPMFSCSVQNRKSFFVEEYEKNRMKPCGEIGGTSVQRIMFDLREQRHVKLQVKSTNGDAFKIRYAKFNLLNNGEVESSGECAIEDDVIDMFLTPAKRMNYILEVEYGIADEVYVEKIELVVR